MLGLLSRRVAAARSATATVRGIHTSRAAMIRQSQPCCHGHGYDSAGAHLFPSGSPLSLVFAALVPRYL
jgi:hypothetical protein